MSRIYLPWNASKARLRDAEHARRNRAEIVRELSWGRISRRDLFKWGLLTGAGMLAPIGGLNPFVASVKGQALGSTGAPPSRLLGCDNFTQPMVRFDVMARNPVSCLSPLPMAEANQTQHAVDPRLGGWPGPLVGRPAGAAGAAQPVHGAH